MAKPGAVRRREYEQQKKEEDKEAYLQKRCDHKRKQRELLKASKVKYQAQKLKDRIRKKKSSDRGNIINTSHKYFIFRVFTQLQTISWKSSCSW